MIKRDTCPIDIFFSECNQARSKGLVKELCQKRILDGLPYVFKEKTSDDYFNFRKKIADHFEIPFNSIYITGSARLGFSYHKKTRFSLDSDIDIALVSQSLFEEYMGFIHKFQLALHYNPSILTYDQNKTYFKFLKYAALGWIRPDLLPIYIQTTGIKALKKDWFDFFNSISSGRSEVGNYKVSAGIFKNYDYLTEYTTLSLERALGSEI